VAINNHRTQRGDLDLLIRETMRIGKEAGNAASAVSPRVSGRQAPAAR
jgi:hypothetical protein